MENPTSHRRARQLPDDERAGLIKWTVLRPQGSYLVLFSSAKKFPVQRVLDFVDEHFPARGAQVTWMPGKIEDGEVTCEWQASVRWRAPLPRLTSRLKHHVTWLKLDAESGWVPLSYNRAWRGCLIAQDLYEGADFACEECGQTPNDCAESWLYPVLEKQLGVPFDAGTDPWNKLRVDSYHGVRYVHLYPEESHSPGFVFFPPRTVRMDHEDLFFPRDNWITGRDVDLSWENIDDAHDATVDIARRAAATRVRHNAVCGYKKERCVFRDFGCDRWGRWNEASRSCTRKWLASEDVVKAGLEEWKGVHDAVPWRDLQVAAMLGGAGIHARYPGTGYRRHHVYRGVSRYRGILQHVLMAYEGHTPVEAIRGTWTQILQYVRRNAPSEYPRFRDAWARAHRHKITDLTALMLLELAEYDFYDGKPISSVTVRKFRDWGPRNVDWDKRPWVEEVSVYAQNRQAAYRNVESLFMDHKLMGWNTWGMWVPK